MNISPYRQTQLVIWFNQIFFFGYALLNFQWWMVPITFVMVFVFGAMSEVSLHRYFTHKSYKTTEFKQLLLTAFAFLTGQGATVSWVTVHRTHHAFEDTAKDPHSPHHLKWWEIYLAFLPKEYKNNLVVDLMRSPRWKYFMFENANYFYMWVVLWVAAYLLSPLVFFLLVCGVASWYIATCVINTVTHTRGVKVYPEAVAYNSAIINLFTGVGNHNNHHKFPKSHTYGVNGEIDPYGFLIEKFLMVK